MNPHKMNKVDISQMSEQDQKAFKLYGKLPSKNVLTKMQKDRKYFDSGDYMMNKAGVQSAQAPGTAIPTPEGLPHAFSPPASTSPIAGMSSSPGASLLSQTAPGGGAAPAPAGSPVNVPGRASLSPTNSQGSISSSGASGGNGSAPMAVPGGGHEGAHAHAAPTFAPSFGGVGVGISPAASGDGMDMPMGGHRRRPSESFSRTSPPAALREGQMPSSSYPIQHQAFGSSPVKTSLLARRAVEENE